MLYIYSVNRLASSASQGLFSPDFVLDIPGSVGRVEALLYCSVSATLAANVSTNSYSLLVSCLTCHHGQR